MPRKKKRIEHNDLRITAWAQKLPQELRPAAPGTHCTPGDCRGWELIEPISLQRFRVLLQRINQIVWRCLECNCVTIVMRNQKILATHMSYESYVDRSRDFKGPKRCFPMFSSNLRNLGRFFASQTHGRKHHLQGHLPGMRQDPLGRAVPVPETAWQAWRHEGSWRQNKLLTDW